MPVNLLLCEGVPTSADVRVLTCLFRGYCQVMPIGSKHSMLNQIEVRRREVGLNFENISEEIKQMVAIFLYEHKQISLSKACGITTRITFNKG